MALEHAILTSLAERAASGYDLTRRFDASIGFFWTATHQQIYRVLARMEDDDLVTATIEPGEGRPDRKVYDLTDKGRQELATWTTLPSRREPVRSELAVKVRAMDFGDRAAVVRDIRRQHAMHHERLKLYESEVAAPSRTQAVDDSDLPVYLVLLGGIHQEGGYVQWCEEMLRFLASDADPTTV